MDLPKTGIHQKELERQALLLFPVSKTMVKKFIQEYYIDLEYVKLSGDILIPEKNM